LFSTSQTKEGLYAKTAKTRNVTENMACTSLKQTKAASGAYYFPWSHEENNKLCLFTEELFAQYLQLQFMPNTKLLLPLAQRY